MFTRSISDFQQLFDFDNIRDGTSLQKISQWGCTTGLLSSLKTSQIKGLSDDKKTKKQRIMKYGQNKLFSRSLTYWRLVSITLFKFAESCEDDMLRILCYASVISMMLGIKTEGFKQGWIQGFSTIVGVIIIIAVGSGINWIKEKKIKQNENIFNNRYVKKVDVIRNGKIQNILVENLLVGDIQIIETGQILSVDGFLIESSNIIADESSMTGESTGIKKAIPTWTDKSKVNPFLISNSKILQGTGKMLVLAIGQHSQYGILNRKIQICEDQTPFQQQLGILADQIGKVGINVALVVFMCLCGHIIYGAYDSNKFFRYLWSLHTLHNIVDSFIAVVCIIIISVPQGLPLAVTTALAYSIQKMRKDNNLVRSLQACQKMGEIDNICTDKTGTITKNVMTVTHVFIQERTVSHISKQFVSPVIRELISVGVAVNSNASPIIEVVNGHKLIKQIGNKTECALLDLAYTLGYDYRDVRKTYENSIIKVINFSYETKTMSIAISQNEKIMIYSKGAPDYLLKNCIFYLNANGCPTPITNSYKNCLLVKCKEFADLNLRTLLLAYREGTNETNATLNEDIQKNLIIIGMVGIKDPLREAVPKAVQICFKAGVRVRMITGDNQKTAVTIAKEAGILEASWQPSEGDYTVMTGSDFRNFVGGLVNDGEDEVVSNLQNFKIVRDQLKVLSRSSPSDKYLMATGLKQLHHVVAMTGDGTGDAPALKRSDVGLAMGIDGTQVAKQASGIILMDDNFCSIVVGLKWGRNIFDCIRKLLQFQLTVNISILVLSVLGVIFFKESPFKPIQILWINLIMDTLASLALTTEPPCSQLLESKPHSRLQNLVTPDMWKNIITQSTLQIVVLGLILFKGPQLFGIQSSFGNKKWTNQTGKHYCVFFHTFVLMQIFNEINCRKLKSSEMNVFQNFFNNPLFFFILIVTVAIQFAFVQFGGQFLRTVPLNVHEHFTCLLLGMLSLLFSPIFKKVVPVSIFRNFSLSLKDQ